MACHVLRVPRQQGELLLGHDLLDVLAELHDLLSVSRSLKVELLIHSHALLAFRVGLWPDTLIVEPNVVVQALLDLHDSILKSGKRRWRFLICRVENKLEIF